MSRPDDVKTFDAVSYRAAVREMRSRGEDVYATGRRHLQETGTLHPYVDVTKNRGSHNAMVPGEEPGTHVLVNGIALPIINMFDGTGSTSYWLDAFFHAAERQYDLLDGIRTRYNTQMASSVVQDVTDRTPVVQLSQFESDERVAEQVRFLQPWSHGGDAPEDYDLGLAAGLYVYADLWTYYGLKGYFTLTADEIGRGFVTEANVSRHLGQSLTTIQGGNPMNTQELCQRLMDKWHVFLLQVPSNGGYMHPHTTQWWNEVLGPGRVILVDNPDLLAEVRAALVYVTEAEVPTKQGLARFMQNGNTSYVKADQLDKIWKMIQVAKEHFSAQAKLPGYQDIPRPGDIFAHYRDPWPIGHPRQSENPVYEEVETSPLQDSL